MSAPNPARPPLKLKLSTSGHAHAPPPVETPSTGTPKLKIKLGSKTPTPAEQLPGPSPSGPVKKGRKPSAAKAKVPTNGAGPTSKKRSKDQDELARGDGEASKTFKKIRLTASTRTPTTPIVRAKLKGKPPPRPLGVGYDSESSDREEDPAIEEEFILRMPPGDDCDYLRQAIEEKRLGLPRRDGGADVQMKFLSSDGRRAIVTIKGKHYAATLVDLPCIIEGMKSWDRRGWWKSADICQMLLVFAQVPDEKAALTVPLPREVDLKTHQYPHGLTPPMHYVRKRRFRKRVSNRTIEAVEDEVERLLQADQECITGSSRTEIIDPTARATSSVRSDSEEAYNMLGSAGMQYTEEDAEGELEDSEYFGQANGNMDDELDLEADLEQAMMAANEEETAPTADHAAALGAVINGAAGTPSVGASGAEESPDDESDADLDDDGGPDQIDEDLLERQQDIQRQREEITDLEQAILEQTREMENMQNPLLKGKIRQKIQSLKTGLEMKRAAIGEGTDD